MRNGGEKVSGRERKGEGGFFSKLKPLVIFRSSQNVRKEIVSHTDALFM